MSKKIMIILLALALVFTAACSMPGMGKAPAAPSAAPGEAAGDAAEAPSGDAPAAPDAPAEGTVYTLKISTSQTEQSLIAQGYMLFAERLKENSGGRLVAEVFPSSTLGNDEDVIEQAIQGAAVAVNTDAARMGTYVKEMGILMMGFFADNYEECNKVTQTAKFAQWEEQLAGEHGIRVLAFNFYDGPRYFMTNKPINSPEDLKGQRIRTIGAEVCTETIAALGATPVAMPWGEVYNAVQSKAVDGCEVQNTSAYPSRIYEVAKNQSKTGHFQLLQGLVCGENWYKTLPDDLKAILIETARTVGAESAAAVMAETEACEKRMAEAGLEIVEPDLAAFKAAVEPAYEKLGFAQLRDEIYAEIGKSK